MNNHFSRRTVIGPASPKEARKEANTMHEDIRYEYTGLRPEQVTAHPVNELARVDRTIPADDIEVIDLDDPRGQIKPTTWHQ